MAVTRRRRAMASIKICSTVTVAPRSLCIAAFGGSAAVSQGACRAQARRSREEPHRVAIDLVPGSLDGASGVGCGQAGYDSTTDYSSRSATTRLALVEGFTDAARKRS